MPRDEYPSCLRCGAVPAVDAAGYCGHCHWAVRAELDQGFREIGGYLAGWARFEDWCEQHGEVACP